MEQRGTTSTANRGKGTRTKVQKGKDSPKAERAGEGSPKVEKAAAAKEDSLVISVEKEAKHRAWEPREYEKVLPPDSKVKKWQQLYNDKMQEHFGAFQEDGERL